MFNYMRRMSLVYVHIKYFIFKLLVHYTFV